jgi:hypothetical protein
MSKLQIWHEMTQSNDGIPLSFRLPVNSSEDDEFDKSYM